MQGVLKARHALDGEPCGDRDVGGEFLVEDLAAMCFHCQAHPLEEGIVRSHEHGVGGDLFCTGQGVQYGPHCVAVGADQAAGAQLGAPEIAGHHHGDVAQAAAAQDGERGAACRPRRLAVVAGVGHDRGAVAHQVDGHVVAGIGELLADAGHETLCLVHGENRRRGSDKARVEHLELDARLPRRDGVALHLAASLSARRAMLPQSDHEDSPSCWRMSLGGREPQPRMASCISRMESSGCAARNSATISRMASLPMRYDWGWVGDWV